MTKDRSVVQELSDVHHSISDEGNYLVGIVIVNWNNYEDTSRCIESLQKQYGAIAIYLVDNGSTDSSKYKLENEFDGITFVVATKNLGFSAAVNSGIEAAVADGATHLMLVNNDVIVQDPTVVASLRQFLDAHEEVGLVSPRVIDADSGDIWFERGCINWKVGMSTHANNAKRWVHGIERSTPDPEREYLSNQYIPFCAVLFKRSLYDSVGPLPEKYFLYYEDIEYCTRIRDEGYELATAADVAVLHKGSASSGGQTSPIASYYTARNHQVFLRQYKQRIHRHIAFGVYLWWMTLLTGYRLRRREWEAVAALWRGIFDGFCNKTEKGRYPRE